MKGVSIKTADLEFGLKNEDKNIPVLRKMFGEDLAKTTNKFSPRDFFNQNFYIEQKSRKIKSTDYDDYMIGSNKIEDALKADRNYIIVFDLIDGTFFYQFNKDHLGNGIEKRMGGRFDRKDSSGNLIDERKLCYYIHKRLLTRINRDI